MRAFTIIIGSVVLAGCGDDFTKLSGIYTINTWTQNDTACDAEGPSVASTREPMFYIRKEDFLGLEFLNVSLCDDLAMCEADAADENTINLGGWSFEEGNDTAGWTDQSAFAFDSNGTCTGSVRDTIMTSVDRMVRIESRERDVAPFPPVGGDCPDEDAVAAAEGQPCTSLEVTTATFMQDI
jgi:hypothetical protein